MKCQDLKAFLQEAPVLYPNPADHPTQPGVLRETARQQSQTADPILDVLGSLPEEPISPKEIDTCGWIALGRRGDLRHDKAAEYHRALSRTSSTPAPGLELGQPHVLLSRIGVAADHTWYAQALVTLI